MSELRITELDFLTIKENLKNFLKSQTEFLDYDFDGSGLNVLLDVLAYNTHYNAVLAHFMSNEMFIDTAIKRESVISIAKMLGYIPRSSVCAHARITMSANTAITLPITLDTTVKFSATINNASYTFSPLVPVTVTPVNGVVTFSNVELIEGARLENSFVVVSDNRSGPFVIPTQSVDLSTLQVTVETNNVPTIYTRATSVIDVTPTSTVFWVEENSTGFYQVIFGDDIIGKQLGVGDTVTIDYLVSSGTAPNGARSFSLNTNLAGLTGVSIQTTANASLGADIESIDSVRFNAPKFNATRNRAVTTQDYKSLIGSDTTISGKINAIAVWGGEENIPPVYGKVFITIDPAAGFVITDDDKQYIIDRILRPRSVMSIQHEFVDPEFVYLGFDVIVSYDPKLTNLSSGDIESLVSSTIQDYFTNNLSTLDKTFFYSKLLERIGSISVSF